jgi:hypothetical protein
MIMSPRCWTRKCKHFTGVIQLDNSELSECPACEAFPTGIPNDIAYGDNKHEDPTPDQGNDIVYEKDDPSD